jgi:hypothetical protein
MFLLYTIVNSKAFEAFPCHDFGADGRWLVADVRVRCDTPEHSRIVSWAWVAICLYPIGWTVMTAVLLFKARKPIMRRDLPVPDRPKPSDLSLALAFITDDYEVRPTHHAYWACQT